MAVPPDPPPTEPASGASTPGVTTGAPCPRCGVTVAFGYVSCPRCHTRMPRAHVAGPLRPGTRSGGTAVEGEGTSPALLGGLVLVLVGAAVAAFLILRDGPSTDAAASGGDLDGGAEEEAGLEAELEPSPDDEPDDPGAPAAASAADQQRERAAVLAELVEALRDQRLWARVRPDEVDPDAVAIESGYCADPRLAATVDEQAAALRTLGFTSVRCAKPHGELVFENPL